MSDDGKSVATLALWACDKPVGAISYGWLSFAREPEAIAGRIDLVVTDRGCRGRGIGALLIAGMVVELSRAFGDRLRRLSVIAVHPSIVRMVEVYSFRRVLENETPLYAIDLPDAGSRQALVLAADAVLGKSMRGLREECTQCQRIGWHTTPWCLPIANSSR